MCDFCDNLNYRSYKIPQRTTSENDTQCEYGSPLKYFNTIIGGTYSCDNCINGV